jgi:hypothetical protein
MFVRGSFFADWGTQSPMTWDGINTYRAELADLTAGTTYQFKVADATWNVTNCGATPGQTLALGTPYPLSCYTTEGGPPNISLPIAESGRYLFAVNAADAAAPLLTVEKVPFAAELYVRGLNGDWSDAAGNRLSYLGGGAYKSVRSVTGSAQQFKIADATWNVTNCGATSGQTAAIDVPYPLTCFTTDGGPPNVSLAFPGDDLYEFMLDATNPAAPQLTVTRP